MIAFFWFGSEEDRGVCQGVGECRDERSIRPPPKPMYRLADLEAPYTTVAGLSVSDRSNGLKHLGTLACAEEPVHASGWLAAFGSDPQRDHASCLGEKGPCLISL